MPQITRDDVALAFEVYGSGPPVVLIHGVGVPGCGWTPQVDALSDSFTLLTNDNRGVGSSTLGKGLSIEKMAEDIQALMEHQGWKSAHLVGHSMGGVIAQQVALNMPQRVRSLGLLCTFFRGKDSSRPSWPMIWAAIGGRIGSRPMRRRAFMGMILTKEEHRTLDIEELADSLSTLFGRDLADQPSILIKQALSLGRHNTSNRLSELGHIPTLVLSGSEDVIAKPASGKALANAIPNAQYVEWDSAGHALPILRAQALNNALSEHLHKAESLWSAP